LAGRFFRHRLLPFSPAELFNVGESVGIARFLERGGFPEPLLAVEDGDADRWRMQYMDGLIRTDIFDFEKIHDLKAIQLVLELLRSRTGSPISYQSLAEDVGVAPNTVKKYIQVLESLFIVFRVTPYANSIARSIVKTPKIYFYDTGLVNGDEGVRFENMMALCLLKHVCGRVNLQGRADALHYVRTRDGAEVDFCLTEDNRPQQLIEAKRADKNPARSPINFSRRYDIPGTQVVLHLRQERKEHDIEVRRGEDFLKALRI